MSNAPAFLSMCALHVLETSTSLLFHPRFVLSFPPSDIARAFLSESCRCGCAVFFDAESKAKFVEMLRGMMMKKTMAMEWRMAVVSAQGRERREPRETHSI